LFALKLRYYHFLEGDKHADAHNAGTKANVDCLRMTEGRYEIRQTWRGLNGGITNGSSRVSLVRIIGRC
jgi:hypothetical protein